MLNRILNRNLINFILPVSNLPKNFPGFPNLRNKVEYYLKETGRRHPALKNQTVPSIIKYKALQIITAPFIYLCFIPTIALDLIVTLFQKVCFPLYGIPSVTRADHVIIDRHKLKYLNLSKKINCVYCGYFTGVISYSQEIAGRTEQYWCPIKHAKKLKNSHSQYEKFIAHGDAKAYQENFVKIRTFDEPSS
jgi:hypothetical protein